LFLWFKHTAWIPDHKTTPVGGLNRLICPEIATDIGEVKRSALGRRGKGFADNGGELSACNWFIFKGAIGKPSNNLLGG
jgi:hypothetical protein